MTDQLEAATIRRWQPGDLVVLRYITMRDGTPGATWPCRVVEDRDDLLALHIPAGTIFKEWQPAPSSPNRQLADTRWRTETLRLMFPGRGHSIWLSWLAGEQRTLRGYYVNFEEPFRRTLLGFDTNDHTLDIVVAPDMQWHWKDRDDFADRVRQGLYTPDFADSVRAEAERVIPVIEGRKSPFSDGWESWAPDPAWTIPELPPVWNTEPVAPWEGRRWAYLVAHENTSPR